MEMYADRKGWDIGDLEVACEYTPAERGCPTRFSLVLRFPPQLSEEQVAKLKVIAAKMAHLSRQEAEQFYAVHKARPFFKDLVSFMISGPVMIQVLEGEGAILKNRDLMGATDPKKAEKGTIRADFADSIDANAVHGSDAAETAANEIAFFFPAMNVYSR